MKGREINANVTNKEEEEYDPDNNGVENGFSEDQWGVNYTRGGEDILSDLDWDEIENYGADSEVGQFLQNNEDTQGYENLQTATDVGVYKVFAKEQIARDRNGKKHEFSGNLTIN